MSRPLSIGVVVLLLAALSGRTAAGPDAPTQRHDFERDPRGAVPEGWQVPPALGAQGAGAAVSDERAGSGARCVRLTNRGPAPIGNLMRSIDAAPYRGQVVRLSALVRADRAGGAAQLWLRVDRPGGARGFFDNMGDRPIRDDAWKRYEIVGQVDDDAAAISFGLLIAGQGRAWLDDVVLEPLGAAAAGLEAARPLTERGLINLTALTRLVGDLRHFHASDECAAADWSTITILAARAVEDARDDRDLARRLSSLVGDLAPTATIATHLGSAPPDFAVAAPPAGAATVRCWEHRGYGQARAGRRGLGLYRSERLRRRIGDGGDPAPDDATVRRLAPGVWSRVPLCALEVEEATVPPAGGHAALAARWPPPEGWLASAEDRTTRIAAVILAWNVLQHFYPYFDVVAVDWAATLPAALRGAATAEDGAAFTAVLERLVAALQDGHGMVTSRRGGGWPLPVAAEWVEGRLVVTAAAGSPPAPGDVIMSIDGRPTGELWRELLPRISGATEGWKRQVGARLMLDRPARQPTFLELRRPDGVDYSAVLTPVPAADRVREAKPAPICELEPGIWYVDIDRTDDDAFAAALPDLADARGLVCDLRGYPTIMHGMLSHLIDEPVSSARWLIPVVRRPDRVGVEFDRSSWQVTPREPRLPRPVFITDGRAISAAETYMGIVEAYGLGAIVGAPTAGTNGNVNSVALPTGHVLMFTGMRVLKHDGSRHHGVGIRPTEPLTRTIRGIADGRDELLERAVRIAAGGRPLGAAPGGGADR